MLLDYNHKEIKTLIHMRSNQRLIIYKLQYCCSVGVHDWLFST